MRVDVYLGSLTQNPEPPLEIRDPVGQYGVSGSGQRIQRRQRYPSRRDPPFLAPLAVQQQLVAVDVPPGQPSQLAEPHP